MYIELAVSIAGDDYLYTTGGVTTLPTSADPAFSSAWYLARGAYSMPETKDAPSWTERFDPIEGDLKLSSQTFRLNDLVVRTGPAAGQPDGVLTWQWTRLPREIQRSVLTASLPRAYAPGQTFDVLDGSQFASADFTVWIDGEAIRCESRSGNTITVESSGSGGRGWYGTRATAHNVVASTAYAPTVWAALPGISRRRAILWWIDARTNVARPLWRGICGRTPKTMASDPEIYELQCDPLWGVLRAAKLGIPSAMCKIRGYDGNAVKLTARSDTIPLGLQSQGVNSADPATMCADLDTALGRAGESLRQRISDVAGVEPLVEAVRVGRGARFTVSWAGTTSISADLVVGTASATGASQDPSAPSATAQLQEVAPTLWLGETNFPKTIGLDTIENLPATWDATDDTSDGQQWWVEPMLRGEYDEERMLELRPTAIGPSPIPYAYATARWVAKGDSTTRDELRQSGTYTLIERATKLRATVHVQADHWLVGLRYGVIEDESELLRDVLAADEWDWSETTRILTLTGVGIGRADWYLDGESTLDDLLTDRMKLAGCGLGVRAARLTPFAFQPPGERDTIAATLDADIDLVVDEDPQWGAFPDALTNVAKVKGELLEGAFIETDSVSKYEQARTVELTLKGLTSEAVNGTPEEIKNTILARVFGLWSEPVRLVKFKTSLYWFVEQELTIGQYIKLTEWSAPDGTGRRGLVERMLQIVGRDPSFQTGHVAWEAIDWSRPGVTGWNASIRVGALSGTTITAATNYAASAGDYAGGASTGGVENFKVGYKVRLRLWSTTPTEWLGEVAAVDPLTGEIELTMAPGMTWEDYVTDGFFVDLVFDHYDDVTTEQQQTGGWVAGGATIQSSGDPAQQWAP